MRNNSPTINNNIPQFLRNKSIEVKYFSLQNNGLFIEKRKIISENIIISYFCIEI